MISVENISKSYSRHKALNDVSFQINKGSVFGLLGPNGAGKTTLIRIINQIIEQDSGKIEIEGEALSSKHIPRIGYLPEERGLYKKMKVGEQLIFFGQLRGLSRAESVAKIKDWTTKLSIYDWIHHKIEDLSKGMAQKIQFIASILHEPEIIILDEPFSGFDPVNANIIKNEIMKFKEKGHTIVFSTHRMESAEELCDEICLINKSEIVLYGTKSEIRNSYRNLKYKVEHIGDLTGLNHQTIILDSTNSLYNSDATTSTIECKDVPSHELIRELSSTNHILSFAEHIPSLNDIFIDVTTKGNE